MNNNNITSFRGTYGFLSNFYDCEIEYEGIKYPSTEHAYQAAKFDDQEIRLEIAKLPTPMAAKRAGKLSFVSDEWKEKSLQIMYDICKLKFQQAKFMNRLLNTGDKEIIEGNTWGDTFWGVCNGVGSNHLGKILMRIRSELQNQ